jgi:hypothetical protein
VEAEDATALGRGLGALLIRVARAANRTWGRRGRLFDDRYHVRQLRTPREAKHAIGYMLRNGWKHRTARRAEIDPASPGRWFQGWSIPVARAADLPAVASPRFWLLTFGRRRWGAIDLNVE